MGDDATSSYPGLVNLCVTHSTDSLADLVANQVLYRAVLPFKGLKNGGEVRSLLEKIDAGLAMDALPDAQAKALRVSAARRQREVRPHVHRVRQRDTGYSPFMQVATA